MITILEDLRSKYLVDGENERYAESFINAEEITEEIDRDIFEEKFDVDIDKLSYPILTFDFAGSSDGWLFEADADEDFIRNRADEYFSKK